MARFVSRLAFPIACLAAVALPSPAAAQQQKSTVVSSRDASPATPVSKGERQLICRGGTIPTGWILVDDVKDPKSCGGENPAVLNTYNVWAIEKYESQPSGAMIDVCAATPTPKGWVLVDIYRDKTRCGHPQDNWGANVKRIRKQG